MRVAAVRCKSAATVLRDTRPHSSEPQRRIVRMEGILFTRFLQLAPDARCHALDDVGIQRSLRQQTRTQKQNDWDPCFDIRFWPESFLSCRHGNRNANHLSRKMSTDAPSGSSCRPVGAGGWGVSLFLGLTPQATICRPVGAGDVGVLLFMGIAPHDYGNSTVPWRTLRVLYILPPRWGWLP
jgi:hypothetical protein